MAQEKRINILKKRCIYLTDADNIGSWKEEEDAHDFNLPLFEEVVKLV